MTMFVEQPLPLPGLVIMLNISLFIFVINFLNNLLVCLFVLETLFVPQSNFPLQETNLLPGGLWSGAHRAG